MTCLAWLRFVVCVGSLALIACKVTAEGTLNEIHNTPDGGGPQGDKDGGPGSLFPFGGSDGGGDASVDGSLPGADDGSVAPDGSASDGGPLGDGGSQTLDAGSCGDTTSDDENCGACGYSCVNGRSCVASRCTPAWQPISDVGAPDARNGHAAVALGGHYVTLGGTLAASGAGAAIATAGVYDPATDTWDDFPSLAEARCFHSAVSTKPDADEYILTFGGLTDCSNGTTIGPGLEVSRNGDAWQSVDAAGEPVVRYNFGAVATPREPFNADLFIYGGSTNSEPAIVSGAFFALGLDGASPKWTSTNCALAQCERGGHFSLFVDGDDIKVWGGGPYGNAPAGLRYSNMDADWHAWSTPAGTPTVPQRFADDGRRIYFLEAKSSACPSPLQVLIYDRESASWETDSVAAPSGLLAQAAAAWVGSELVAWSGNCGSGASSVGGRYQPPAP